MGNAQAHGGMTTFNIDYGLEEGLCRGFRSGFITIAQYSALMDFKESKSSENQTNLADLRDALSETHYGRFLADFSGDLQSSDIRDKMQEKLASEFEYLRCLAGPKLLKFLDFITYEFMIENLVTILRSSLLGRKDFAAIVAGCHPLGRFDENTERSIMAFENSPEGYHELYRTVLVETPIGKYFQRFLIETKKDARKMKSDEGRRLVMEETPVILENWLMKLYLEDFYAYCQTLGGETAAMMLPILEARADKFAVSVTLNSFGTDLAKPAYLHDRADLYPSFGRLYAHGAGSRVPGVQGNAPMSLVNVKNMAEFKQALQHNDPMYRNLAAEMTEHDFTDLSYAREVQLNELAFEGQFSFAIFYAYVKLKQQEIRNVCWIANCVTIGAGADTESMKAKLIPIFWDKSPWRTGALAEAAMRNRN